MRKIGATPENPLFARRPDIAKLEIFWREKNYAAILALPLTHMSCVKAEGMAFHTIARELAQSCPEEIARKNPLAMLRIAYTLSEEDMAAFDSLMRRIEDWIAQLPESEEKTALLGEWQLVDSFRHFPDLERMLSPLERAAALLQGPSRVLAATEPFFYRVQGIVGVCHLTPGKADETGELLRRYVALYSQCTGGGGIGADVLYQAELCYYRADIQKAELLCYKAAYLAEITGQDIIWMGALTQLAQIAIHRNEPENFRLALANMDKAVTRNPLNAPLGVLPLEYAHSALAAELEQPEKMAAWVALGDSSAYPRQSRLYVDYLAVRYQFLRANSARAIGMAEGWCDGIGHGALVQAVLWFYAAAAYKQLGLFDEGLDCVRKAVALCLPDGFILLLGSFYNWLEEWIEEATASQPQRLTDKLRSLRRDYLKGWNTAFVVFLGNKDPTTALTRRERDVAALAAKRISNQEIAARLHMSENTVKTHLRSLYQKLGVKKRKELAKIFAPPGQ